MKLETIKNNRDFLKVYKKGTSYVGAYTVLYVLKRDDDAKRIGITASKKVGKAVVRNRVRRLIRNSIIMEWKKLPAGYDYVFVARVKSAGSSLEQIHKNINYLVNKVNSSNKKKSKRKVNSSKKVK